MTGEGPKWYRNIKVLCWLHHYTRQTSAQQSECSKEHVSQPDKEHDAHMQGQAKCDVTGDTNGAAQHKSDHHKDSQSKAQSSTSLQVSKCYN